ncbi:phage holin family protein [Abyssisolibacter fermentans]|uniref:phage holin family protein n=1 Tax=Abyssisolibacter fermentans TaxID=1766203 RepID=UPI0008299EBC|nr:phage holin family protein [Abyssisolibacter fermentans]
MKIDAFIFLLGSLTGFIAYLAGLNFEIIMLWLILLVLDLISGLLKAFRTRHFSSHCMRLGLTKKAAEVILLCAVVSGQRILSINGFEIPLLEIFVCALCFKEFGSILENCNTMGVKIPEIIMKWLRILDDQINNNDDS